MTLNDIAHMLNAKAICCEEKLEHDINAAFASDLMSDVLTIHDSTHVLLITGLVNVQTIRTAEMSDIQHIVFVRNKKVSSEIIAMAKELGICLLECEYSMYRTCGILFCNQVAPLY